LESRPAGRAVHAAPARLRRDAQLGGWLVPLPTIDGTVVRRSAAALERYGPDFTYGHNLVAAHLSTVAGLSAGVSALALLAPLPPTRKLLLRARRSGDGPSEAERERSSFRVTFLGEGGGERVVTEVSGGDPGYSETAKMLSESGLCLAFDELPPTSGQVTTAAAMGDALLERLQAADIAFRVLERTGVDGSLVKGAASA
jgi:short subunit dehydrogenase-like uncharacterized protein